MSKIKSALWKGGLLLALVAISAVAVMSEVDAKVALPLAGQLNINTAQVDELTELPGIGVKRAEAIVAYRTQTPFKSVDELLAIKGIGPDLLETLKPNIKTSGDSDLHPAAAQ